MRSDLRGALKLQRYGRMSLQLRQIIEDKELVIK